MTLALDLTQLVLRDEAEQYVSPETTLLWAMFDRALRDLDLTMPGSAPNARGALTWLRDTNNDDFNRLSFGCVIEHCHPSARLLKLTAEKIREIEQAVKQLDD